MYIYIYKERERHLAGEIDLDIGDTYASRYQEGGREGKRERARESERDKDSESERESEREGHLAEALAVDIGDEHVDVRDIAFPTHLQYRGASLIRKRRPLGPNLRLCLGS